MSAAERVIRFAALLLPKVLRDRYREQWSSDLRDAAEADIPTHEIAMGALAFAATVARPLPFNWGGLPTPALVERRSRLAAALALAAAALAVSGFTRIFGSEDLTGVVGYDLVIELVGALLGGFSVFAPIVAVVIVTRTRATEPRVRRAVWLLALASLAPLAHIALDGFPIMDGEAYYAFGGLAYVAAVVPLVLALRLLWLGLHHGAARLQPRAVGWSALVVVAIGGLACAQAAYAWAHRTPLLFSWQPAVSVTYGADGAMVREEIPTTLGDYLQWLEMKQSFESMVSAGFVALAVTIGALLLLLVLLSKMLRLSAIQLAVAAVAVVLIVGAALVALMGWAPATPIVPAEILLTTGRATLVGVILYGVGGMRLETNRLARVRHRHDVEGAVELL